jgi:hypothetical protein
MKHKKLHRLSGLQFKNLNELLIKRDFKIIKKIDLPHTIVAGTSEKLSDKESDKYKEYFIKTFRDYSGTIISGGTTSGIPGVLGSAVREIRKSGNNEIILLGYVPNKNVDICEDYQIITTGGDDFSFLEPIMMWHDIVLSGIEPEKVRVIGIGGGKISAVEYRMALTFGANLGIVKDSGRAADEILLSKEWSGHKNLQILSLETKFKQEH